MYVDNARMMDDTEAITFHTTGMDASDNSGNEVAVRGF